MIKRYLWSHFDIKRNIPKDFWIKQENEIECFAIRYSADLTASPVVEIINSEICEVRA